MTNNNIDKLLGIFNIVDRGKVSPAAPPILTKEEYIKLKQALEDLIIRERSTAAIEELRKIRQWKGTIFHNDIMDYCADRIKQLKGSGGDNG